MWKPLSLVLAASLVASTTGTDPARVTSDQPDFCNQLAERIATAWHQTRPSGDAWLMREEGVALCATGHTRAGIARLRHAWLLAREQPAGEP